MLPRHSLEVHRNCPPISFAWTAGIVLTASLNDTRFVLYLCVHVLSMLFAPSKASRFKILFSVLVSHLSYRCFFCVSRDYRYNTHCDDRLPVFFSPFFYLRRVTYIVFSTLFWICSALITEYDCTQWLSAVDITSCLFNYQLKAALWEVQSVQKRWSHMPSIYFKRQASVSFDISIYGTALTA